MPAAARRPARADYQTLAERMAEKRKRLLAALAQNGGMIYKALRAADMSSAVLYRWRQTDAEFEAEFQAALERGVQRMEDEAKRRGIEGVPRKVFYKGKQIDTVQDYSDTLLIFMLKAARPEVYRERLDITGRIDVNALDISTLTDQELSMIAAGKATQEMIERIRERQALRDSGVVANSPQQLIEHRPQPAAATREALECGAEGADGAAGEGPVLDSTGTPGSS